MAGRLERIPQGRILGGVCTGLARYLNMDLTLVRVIMIAVVLFTGIGPFIYLAAWLAMPEQNKANSGLDSLIGQAKDWNAQRQVKQPGSSANNGQQSETFDLYNDRRN